LSIAIMIKRIGKSQIQKCIKSVEQAGPRVLQRICDRVLEISAQNISTNSVDRGLLLKSGYSYLTSKNSAVVGYSAPYAPYVEFGTQPGYTPPFGRLRPWVARHIKALGIRGHVTTRKQRGRFYGDSEYMLKTAQKLERKTDQERQIDDMTWRIIKTIEKQGTDPKPFLRPALQIAEAELKEMVEMEWQVVLEELTYGGYSY
jgi:hypothetical protein